MRLVRLSRVKPEEELAQSIINSDGGILLKAGTKLSELYINRLSKMGIQYLYVKDPDLEDIDPEDMKFLELKSGAVKSISNVFSKVQSSSKFKIKDTIGAIESMIDYLTSNREITALHLTELKTFDNYTYVHSLNTAVIAIYFGIEMKFNKNMLLDLGIGTILHDIGKTKVPIEILNKTTMLTDEEFGIMKLHPRCGYDILQKTDYVSERSAKIALQHHEKIDGTGYPYGLTGDKISTYAKIACISDVYDALVSDRVYRRGFPPHEAYEIIMINSGKMLDENLVRIFKGNFSMYPLGSEVVLSNGIRAFVIGHNKGFPDRPIVRITRDELGEKSKVLEIDLLNELNITVSKIDI